MDVVFDKVESAESEELLQQRREKIEAELEVAREKAKSAEEEAARKTAERRSKLLEHKLEVFDARVARRKEEQSGKDRRPGGD